MSYEIEYKAMREAMVRVNGDLLKQLTVTCQQNPWIKVGGAEFEPEGFCTESDYPYSLFKFEDIDMLEKFFDHGNWSVRSAVQFKDLIFVNQVNGGDEWWTLKMDADKLIPFESITFGGLIKRGEFKTMIERLNAATADDCINLKY